MSRQARDWMGLPIRRSPPHHGRLRLTVARSLAFLGAFMLLGACAQLQAVQAVVGQGIAAKKQVNDSKARLLVQAPCDMAVGAFWRELNKLERSAVNDLCGGERAGD